MGAAETDRVTVRTIWWCTNVYAPSQDVRRAGRGMYPRVDGWLKHESRGEDRFRSCSPFQRCVP
eukprot:scaffold141802_cov33-Tisochrysis_lutea.AAC.3